MPTPAIRCEESEGRLTLWLDTPGSPVNIFGHAAARQLDLILDSLSSRPARTLVLRSAKPGSFINGAGLLHAASMGSPSAARTASASVRRVYERLARAKIFKVAVIDGNCF